MAARIQEGEHVRGRKDFWGFIWPGAAGEGLTCNALEWQVSEGGGRIIEADGAISVNNPDAIRSWQRAAHWIGWISPRSVTSLQEWDAINDFYNLETSAFLRGWARSYLLRIRDTPPIRDQIGMTNIPAGKNAQAATLGGFGLGISRSSRNPAEALQLVRFLVHKEIKLEEAGNESQNGQEFYDPTAILRTNRNSAGNGKQPVSGVVARPSTAAGEKYEEVSKARLQERNTKKFRKHIFRQCALFCWAKAGRQRLRHRWNSNWCGLPVSNQDRRAGITLQKRRPWEWYLRLPLVRLVGHHTRTSNR
jgi:trehalose/maltose transport system substrate-binding protein